jgi:hypothetical protein
MSIIELAEAVEKLRVEAIFEECSEGCFSLEREGTLDPLAAQEYLQGLALLEAAQRCFKKADIHQTRGVAESQRRGLI